VCVCVCVRVRVRGSVGCCGCVSGTCSYLPMKLWAESYELRDRRESIAREFLEKVEANARALPSEEDSSTPSFARRLLTAAKEAEGEPSGRESKAPVFERLDVLNLCTAIMIAASDAPAITLQWLTIMLANNYDVQRRIHEEVDRVLGPLGINAQEQRIDDVLNTENLPNCCAVLREVMRLRPKSYLGIPHACSQDTVITVDGKQYTVPAGALVALNSYGIELDESRHINARRFDPDRYMHGYERSTANMARSQDPELIAGRDHFAFGIGRRACPGVDFAERELLTAVALLCWAFEIKRPNEHEALDQDTIRFERSFSPKPFEVTFPTPASNGYACSL
jgi:cytochrome P450